MDSESWRSIRDTLIDAQWLKRLDRGHYLLSRDLHQVSLASLVDLIRSESYFDLKGDALPWQEEATKLLRGSRDQQAARLDMSLATLFSQGDSAN